MIPLNRAVAFLGPVIASVAGAAATWILVKLNALGISGLDQSDLAQQIASGLTFGLTSLLVWLGQSKWLSGLQLWEQNEAMVQAAALAAPAPALSDQWVIGIDPEHDALMELGGDLPDLPDDDTEFAAPPDHTDESVPDAPDLSGRVDPPPSDTLASPAP